MVINPPVINPDTGCLFVAAKRGFRMIRIGWDRWVATEHTHRADQTGALRPATPDEIAGIR